MSFGFLLFAVEALIFWTASRAYTGAIVLALVAAVGTMSYYYRASPKKIFLPILLVALITFFAGFLYFHNFLYRFQQISLFPLLLEEQIEQIRPVVESQVAGNSVALPEIYSPIMETRAAGFQYYFSFFRYDPLVPLLGVGISHEQKFGLFLAPESGGDGLQVGRSIIFDIFLYGGIGAAFALLILTCLVFKRIALLFKMRRESDQGPIYILAPAVTLLGWWAAAVFLGTPLTLIPNWILLGMALAPHSS